MAPGGRNWQLIFPKYPPLCDVTATRINFAQGKGSFCCLLSQLLFVATTEIILRQCKRSFSY
jgi:hypothetical protein